MLKMMRKSKKGNFTSNATSGLVQTQAISKSLMLFGLCWKILKHNTSSINLLFLNNSKVPLFTLCFYKIKTFFSLYILHFSPSYRSMGCILYEFCTLEKLFPSSSNLSNPPTTSQNSSTPTNPPPTNQPTTIQNPTNSTLDNGPAIQAHISKASSAILFPLKETFLQ